MDYGTVYSWKELCLLRSRAPLDEGMGDPKVCYFLSERPGGDYSCVRREIRTKKDLDDPPAEPDAVILLTTKRIRRIWNPTGHRTRTVINNFLVPPGLGPPASQPQQWVRREAVKEIGE